jgi:pimeloyl-ACP methyl ester carboxylesterase
LSLKERMGGVQAVMRAAGSARAVLFGYSEGAPMSILFAATYPEQVTALILGSAAARWFPGPDYPCGQAAVVMYESLRDIAAHRWGQGDSIEWYLPSRATSRHARELFARFERYLAERIAGATVLRTAGRPLAAIRRRRAQRRAVRRDRGLPRRRAVAVPAAGNKHRFAGEHGIARYVMLMVCPVTP